MIVAEVAQASNQTGFWDCTRAEYDQDETRLRSTRLRDFIEHGPWYYNAVHLSKTCPRREPTEEMVLGTLAHQFILQGQSCWVVWHGGTRRGKEWDAFALAHVALPILRAVDDERVRGMREAVFANRPARALIEADGFEEQAIRWQHETGTPCKALLDRLQHSGVIADLKTSNDPTPKAFWRQSIELGYFQSAAFYELARNSVIGQVNAPFYHVVVGKSQPYRCVVYQVASDVLRVGHSMVRAAMTQLAECLALDNWPDPLDQINHVPTPSWWLQEHGFGY